MGDRETRIVARWRNRNLAQALRATLARAFPPRDEAGFGEPKAIDEPQGNIRSDGAGTRPD